MSILLGASTITLPVAATDLRGARQDALRTDLRQLRARIDRSPASVGHDLDRAWRRAWWLRVEAPRDPRSFERLDQIRDLRRRADRAARRAPVGPFRTDAPASTVLLRPVRQPPAGDLRGTALPIGAGKRFVLIQNGLRQAAESLDRGDVDAARRGLAAARADLGVVAEQLGENGLGEDPNVVALEGELMRLDAKLAMGAGG